MTNFVIKAVQGSQLTTLLNMEHMALAGGCQPAGHSMGWGSRPSRVAASLPGAARGGACRCQRAGDPGEEAQGWAFAHLCCPSAHSSES